MLVSSHSPWFVGALLGLTIIWLLLVSFFHHYLKRHHPSEFSVLGQPGFQKRGSALATIKYIFLRQHKHLNDRKFSLLCDAMVVCFSVVNLLFLAIMFGYAGGPTIVNL